jgi:hypothetical protein
MNRIKIYNKGREAINKPIIEKANNMAGLRKAWKKMDASIVHGALQ